jgi:hypothetical protein
MAFVHVRVGCSAGWLSLSSRPDEIRHRRTVGTLVIKSRYRVSADGCRDGWVSVCTCRRASFLVVCTWMWSMEMRPRATATVPGSEAEQATTPATSTRASRASTHFRLSTCCAKCDAIVVVGLGKGRARQMTSSLPRGEGIRSWLVATG